MLKHQLGRRNLNDAQRIKLALLLKPHLIREAKEKQRSGGQEKVTQHVGQPRHERSVNAQVAATAGVSHEQVRRAEVVYEEADEETVSAMERGDISVRKAYQETRPSKSAPI